MSGWENCWGMSAGRCHMRGKILQSASEQDTDLLELAATLYILVDNDLNKRIYYNSRTPMFSSVHILTLPHDVG